jgi:hypothetical protein
MISQGAFVATAEWGRLELLDYAHGLVRCRWLAAYCSVHKLTPCVIWVRPESIGLTDAHLQEINVENPHARRWRA